MSRVLNDSGYADPDTRARVLRAAADLNYQRNVNWSRLKSQSSQTILFLLGNRQNILTMHMNVLVSCERALRSQGYDLIFARYEYAARARASELTLPRLLEQSGAVDGVLLAGVHHPNLLQVLDKRHLPYAMLGNAFTGPADTMAQNCIFYDDGGAIEEATSYLVRLGHRRIAFLGNQALPWFDRRFAGYRRAMTAHGLAVLTGSEDWLMSDLDYGQLATAQLLRGAQVPTALVAGNDEVAAGAWRELWRQKIAIPRQMSLIGLGDRAEYAILEPALSSISVFAEQLGERLTAMLMRRIRTPQEQPASETYPCKLIERASCGPHVEVRPLAEIKRTLP